MNILILIALTTSTLAFSQSKYMDGKNYCKTIQKKENGKWLDVPKNHQKPDGAKTSIYHWFLGNKYDPKKPTIVHVEGGPGGTAHAYQSWMDKVAGLGYNVLFFDQRGYVCSRPTLAVDQADSKFYSVENTARDMEALRKSLGIEKWTVYGHSYGTPLSYKYASLFPSSIKSVILEGPANLAPDTKEHYDAYKKRLLEKTKGLVNDDAYSCVEKNPSEFENNLNTLASVAGMAGARSYAKLVNAKYARSKSLPTGEETDSLVDSVASKVSKGAHVFPGAEKFQWEPENTELIVENEFPCSDLISQDEEGCQIGGTRMNQSFDARKLKVDVPVYFFLGELDGTPVEQIQDIQKSMKSPNYLVEIKDVGHNSFQDSIDLGGEKAKTRMTSIFKKAAEGQTIAESDVAALNQGQEFNLKLHP